jgi:lipid II:glycine glycyltransferase (peptidoglycan interpeptide bridge formation enzyme)
VSSIDAIWTSALSGSEGDEYDAFVAGAKGGHYAQTRAWGKTLSANLMALEYFLARRSGRVVAAGLVRRPLVARRLALPLLKFDRGPVLNNPDDADDVLRALLRSARSRAGLRVSVMPYWSGDTRMAIEEALRRNGFADVQRVDGSHVRSLRLDLTALPQDHLFEGTALSKVRREVRRAERAGASVRPARQEDLARFRQIHENRLRSQRKRLPRPEWYEALGRYFFDDKRCGAMFVCELGGDLISIVFVARHGSVATYVMGESTDGEVSFPKTIQPMACAISWAKAAGLSAFDFGGLPHEDDRDLKRLRIGEFKRSFARTEVAFVHEHARWLLP